MEHAHQRGEVYDGFSKYIISWNKEVAYSNTRLAGFCKFQSFTVKIKRRVYNKT